MTPVDIAALVAEVELLRKSIALAGAKPQKVLAELHAIADHTLQNLQTIEQLEAELALSREVAIELRNDLSTLGGERTRLAEELMRDAPLAATARAWAKAEEESADEIARISKTIPGANYHPSLERAAAARQTLFGLAKAARNGGPSVSIDHIVGPEWLVAERDELLAVLGRLIDSLPACDVCGAPATRAHGRGGKRWCDRCAEKEFDASENETPPPYPRAPPLREAIALRSRLSTTHDG
jgi:hypothetical protein